jgi:hypothetical protein
MHRVLRLLVPCIAAAIALPAVAGPSSDALANCLVDKSSGRDRKDLARWFVVALSAHPEISGMFTMTPAEREDADRKTGRLFTRLVSVDCANEMRAAVKADGSQAFKTGFGKLGEVAVQELMSDAKVQASMNTMEKYIDSDAVKAALAAK